MKVEKGFNSDIVYGGQELHIQTEDWGETNPYLVSRIFRNGAVIQSIKTSYSEVLPKNTRDLASSVRLAMRVQHEQILDLLRSGKLI